MKVLDATSKMVLIELGSIIRFNSYHVYGFEKDGRIETYSPVKQDRSILDKSAGIYIEGAVKTNDGKIHTWAPRCSSIQPSRDWTSTQLECTDSEWDKDYLYSRVDNNTLLIRITESGEVLMGQFHFEKEEFEDEYGMTDYADGYTYIKTGTDFIFSIKSEYVQDIDREYLFYALSSSSEVASQLSDYSGKGLTSEEFLKIKIPCPKIGKQREIVRLAKSKMQDKVLQVGSDIAHMLGTTLSKIGNIISRLERSSVMDEKDRKEVARLRELFSYADRILKVHGKFNFYDLPQETIPLKDFVMGYVDAWKNAHQLNWFNIEVQGNDSISITGNRVALQILMDTMFDNAYRHGFHKKSNPNNKVIIYVGGAGSCREADRAQLVIANNGYPLPEDFTIETFIQKGRYSSSTGRTGLGGFHVYSILDSMGGKVLGFRKVNIDEDCFTTFDFEIPITHLDD